VPWDAFGLMLFARRASIRKKLSRYREGAAIRAR
jgi:hypothetical protein